MKIYQHQLRVRASGIELHAFVSNSYYKVLCFLFTLLFFTSTFFGQINSTTPNQYHTPTAFTTFQLPTSTDVVLKNNIPLQVVVATSPTAMLYWDDNAGNKSRINITNIFSGALNVYADDVSLISNGTDIYCYVTCRVILNGGTTEIRIVPFYWNYTINEIMRLGLSTILLDNRLSGGDLLDGVRISSSDYNGGKRVGVVWQKNNKIYMNIGLANMVNGFISWSHIQYEYFQNLGSQPPIQFGTLKHPDISLSNIAPWPGCFIVTAIRNSNSLIVGYNNNNWISRENQVFYSFNSATKYLRSQKVTNVFGYAFAIVFDEVDNANTKSTVKLMGLIDYVYSTVYTINEIYEQNCTNNYNYKLTGLPNLAVTRRDLSPQVPVDADVEVVWQQIVCSSNDFCNLQSLSKRLNLNFDLTINNNAVPIINPLQSGSSFYLSDAIGTKNSFFGSIASLTNTCKNFYAFDVMDKNTSINGLVGYKQSTCNGTTIRIGDNPFALKKGTIETGVEEIYNTEKSNLKTYPNPANNTIIIESTSTVQKIEIYNSIGSMEQSIKVNNTNRAVIDVQNWINGQYTLKLFTRKGKVEIRKISVQH